MDTIKSILSFIFNAPSLICFFVLSIVSLVIFKPFRSYVIAMANDKDKIELVAQTVLKYATISSVFFYIFLFIHLYKH